MSVSKFKFVSPGIQIAEIDNSQLPRLPDEVGPVIIGRAVQGPGLRPVQVDSFSDFVEIFGLPEGGGTGEDVWRNGGEGLAPTYGSYAAQAYLRNSSPITFVRLMGASHTNATTAGKAGWEVNAPGFGRDQRAGGAFGLFVMPTGSGGRAATGSLGAIFYLTTGSLELAGRQLKDSGSSETAITGTAALVRASDGNFKMKVKNGAGVVTETVLFNFNRNDKKYIRKVFNTNPTLTNGTITPSAKQKTYWLGETFDRSISGITKEVGVMLAMKSGSAHQGNHRRGLTKALTPYIVSQDIGGDRSSYTHKRLFRFRTHEGGSWEARNLKISISSIKASTNDNDPYGTFTVEIRSAKDSDNARKLLEQFTGCNLNPNSTNYIARKIGDSFATWDDTERRYREYGNYPNQSKYVYVDVQSDVENAVINESYLPFGFEGPTKFKDLMINSGSVTASVPGGGGEVATFVSGGQASPGALDQNFKFMYFTSGSFDTTTKTFLTATLEFPKFQLRQNSTEGNLAAPRDAYFGIDTTRDGSTLFDESYIDMVRAFPADYDANGDTSQTNQEMSFMFTLEDLTRHTGTLSNPGAFSSTTDAYYLSGSRKEGFSISVSGTGTWNSVLKAGFDSFTLPLLGGTDGMDITEADPFRNTLIDGKTELNNYAYNSIKRAIDSVADPEVVEMNLLTMPGLTNTALTDHKIKLCEDRADALAVIDVEGGYIPPSEDNTEDRSTSALRGTADGNSGVVSKMEERNFNTSYGCAFYPWVQVRDGQTGKLVWVPPSVAAIGTFSSSQRKSEVWFAPAGFTRGGLTEGAAGLTVVNVSEKLTSRQRDDLYEVNVNPIASFPAEGIVIFGQKTLQSTPSALDRINVRRLMIHVKREVSRIASRLLFDQNVQTTWNRFLGQVNPFMDGLVAGQGLTEYRVILDDTTTTPDLVDRNIMYAKIFLKPARAIEFIALDFVITSTGASFDD